MHSSNMGTDDQNMGPKDQNILSSLILFGAFALIMAVGGIVNGTTAHLIATATVILVQIAILILLALVNWEVMPCQSTNHNISARNLSMIALFVLLTSVGFYLKARLWTMISIISLLSLANTIWASSSGECSTLNTHALYFLITSDSSSSFSLRALCRSAFSLVRRRFFSSTSFLFLIMSSNYKQQSVSQTVR